MGNPASERKKGPRRRRGTQQQRTSQQTGLLFTTNQTYISNDNANRFNPFLNVNVPGIFSDFLSGMGSVLDLGGARRGLESASDFFSGNFNLPGVPSIAPPGFDLETLLALQNDYRALAGDAEQARIRFLQENEEPARKAS